MSEPPLFQQSLSHKFALTALAVICGVCAATDGIHQALVSQAWAKETGSKETVSNKTGVDAPSDVPPAVIGAMSGRYVPARMDDAGRVISLGDCAHTYIEVTKAGIERTSGGRTNLSQSFTTLVPVPATDGAMYKMQGETEGAVSANRDGASKSSSSPLPWRRSQHDISYFETDAQTYVTITQTDHFTLAGGGEDTFSSHAHYLPCPQGAKKNP